MLKYTAPLGSVVDINILKSLEYSAWKMLVHNYGRENVGKN